MQTAHVCACGQQVQRFKQEPADLKTSRPVWGNRDRGGGHRRQPNRLINGGATDQEKNVKNSRLEVMETGCVWRKEEELFLRVRPAAAWRSAARRHVKLHPDIHVYYGGCVGERA